MAGTPELEFINRQRRVGVDVERVARLTRDALPQCLAQPGRDAPVVLPGLPAVCCVMLSARAMAKAHRKFLGDGNPTDVMTFPYGEILVCPEIALRCAEEFGHSCEIETTLYFIHGLLHLNGYDDRIAAARRRMHTRQNTILGRVRKSVHPLRAGFA